MNIYDTHFYNVLIRFLKEKHLLSKYLDCLRNEFTSEIFDNYDDVLAFIVKIMIDTDVDWSYEFDSLLFDTDLFDNDEFVDRYGGIYREYVDLYCKVRADIYHELIQDEDYDDFSWIHDDDDNDDDDDDIIDDY